MIGNLIVEFGVHMDHIHGKPLAHQPPAGQDVVQILRVAIKDVGVPLGGWQRRNQAGQDRGPSTLDNAPPHQVPLAQHNFQRVREIEVVQVTRHHHPGLGINLQQAVHKLLHHLRLAVPLDLAAQHGGLRRSKQRSIAPLRIPMVGHHKHCLALEHELARQGLATG